MLNLLPGIPSVIPCPAEQIKMPHPFLIFSKSDYLTQIVDINSHTMANSADPDQLASTEAIEVN